MARIAMDITTPIEVRSKLYSELAQYIAPRRKAIEYTGDPTGIRAALGVIVVPRKDAKLGVVTERR